jgi:hypothetical protein
MKTFLQLLEPKLPRAQAEQIAAIVTKKTKTGEIKTAVELSDEVRRLLQLVRRSEDFEPALKAKEPRPPREPIEAELLNGLMEAAGFDIRTLYEMTNSLTGVSGNLKRVLHSQLEELRAGVCRLADDLLGHQIQGDNQYARVITQGFADGRNFSEAGRLAVVDPQTRTLKLDTLDHRRYHQRRGVNPAQVVIRQLSGGLSGVASRTFAPENAIDPDSETFWAEILLADSPIRTRYTYVNGTEVTLDGALVEAELVLGAPEFVTDVKILPFGDFPIDVVDIKIRQGQNLFQYPGFVDRQPGLNWLEWHGPRIQADAVIFVLQQANYSRIRLHLPTAFIELASFWEQLLDEESRLTLSDEVLTQFQTQRAEADARFNSLWEGLRRYGLNLQRLDVPTPDPEARVVADDEVLRRDVEAAVTTMFNQSEIPELHVDHLRPTERREAPGITEVEKFEYVFGARELQANEVNFVNEGYYASPHYTADATILEVRLNTVEEHPAFNVGEGNFRQTSIEYEVELAPGRRAPLLPKGTTLVQDELLIIDASTRSDTTRFPALNTTVTVRRGNRILVTSDYSVVMLATGHLRITLNSSAFFRTARYSVTYTPAANQDLLRVTDLFDSVLLEAPEVHAGTDERGAIALAHYPFVEYSVVNDETRFRREAPRSARFLWLGGSEQRFLDGVMYGNVNTKLSAAITSTATTIGLTSVLGLQTTGLPAKLRIEDEIVQYTGTSGNNLTGVTRGVDGTRAVAHASGTTITGERIYEPLVVTVGNIKALNITDYLSGRHPAFLATSDTAVQYEFIQLGRKLFFNRPITDKPIAVHYRWMSQYVQVHALLRSHTVGRVPQTPVLRRFHTEIISTAL